MGEHNARYVPSLLEMAVATAVMLAGMVIAYLAAFASVLLAPFLFIWLVVRLTNQWADPREARRALDPR